jgi:hypothetical protein
MQRLSSAALLAVSTLLFQAAPAHALPLGMEVMCDPSANLPTDRVPAEGVVSKPPPVYPASAISDWSEGWALFDLTITTTGTTKDITLRDHLGPDGFVNASIDALKTWRYQTTRRNGLPAETYGVQIIMTFVFEDTGQGERQGYNAEFQRRYDEARADIKTGDPAGATRVLGNAFGMRLNLYEQAMGSYLMALALGSANAGNWHQALTHIRHALINNGTFLEPSVKPAAIDLDVLLEAQDGNYQEAFCTYRRERAVGTLLAPQTVQLGEKLAALLGGPAPLVIPAEIAADPRPGMPTQWVHPMVRHKFAFSAIKGNAKSFRLLCLGSVLDSPINEETQWTVPPNAGPCRLFVSADPGTTFQLIEEE